MHSIFIVEDDLGIFQSLKLYLENSQLSVSGESHGAKALDTILNNHFDLIILDINLPGKDGISICKEVRKTSSVPIIMLTAQNTESDMIQGFDCGADDYISKPFSPRELLARIQSVLRRVQSDTHQTDDILTFGDISIDKSKMKVTHQENEIIFTKNEFDLLYKIAQEGGNIVSRETLMREVMGYDNYMFDRTLDTHIKNIRKKLNSKNIIETVRGVGYRFNI